MKRIYTALALMGAFATTASAQKDLSITALAPITNQAYANFAAGDTMRTAAIVKNEGPDNLEAADSVEVSFDLDWVIEPQGYVFRDTYGSADLNAKTAGGADTVGFAFIQGANLGTTPDGPAIVKIPKDALEDGINFRTFGFQIDGTSKVIFDDPGASVSGGQVVYDGNNIANPTGVKFGTPTGLSDLFKNKNREALSTFPNPADKFVSFKYSFGNGTNATVRVTDVAGRVVLTQEFGKQVGDKQLTVDVSALTAGMYYMELVAGDKSASSKITVRK